MSSIFFQLKCANLYIFFQLIRPPPANPCNVFGKLIARNIGYKTYLHNAAYRQFSVFAHPFTPGSVRPDVLAEKGFYLADDRVTIHCIYCFGVAISIEQVQHELKDKTRDQIKNWHLGKAAYCPKAQGLTNIHNTTVQHTSEMR